MPEMKNIRVREAKPRDKGLFRKLWKAYLEELHGKGGMTLPTESNLDSFVRLFEAYTEKEYLGIVLFVGEEAVLMWGDPGESPFETTMGKQATGWGTYVAPNLRKKGVSKQIREVAKQKLKALGFNCVIGSTLLNDEEAVKSTKDWTSLFIVVYCDLDEQKQQNSKGG